MEFYKNKIIFSTFDKHPPFEKCYAPGVFYKNITAYFYCSILKSLASYT